MTDMTMDPAQMQTLQQALQQWQQGQQQPAIDALRPLADQGVPSAMYVLAWFLHQMGDPGWREAIPYVERVVGLGYPWAANYVIGNMTNDPALRSRAVELLKTATTYGLQVDPIGYALPMAQQGDVANSAALVNLH